LDLAQDVMLSAYRALPNFEGRSLYSSWLFAIARNRCFRALRRPRLLWDEEAELEALPDPGLAADRAVEDQQEERLVLRLMEEVLEPQEQTALWLRCAEQLPLDEITRRLALESASGARGLLQTARRKLRAAMAEGGRA
jgi:RNA polymerase sigma-70 factor (ECF subfamily)